MNRKFLIEILILLLMPWLFVLLFMRLYVKPLFNDFTQKTLTFTRTLIDIPKEVTIHIYLPNSARNQMCNCYYIRWNKGDTIYTVDFNTDYNYQPTEYYSIRLTSNNQSDNIALKEYILDKRMLDFIHKNPELELIKKDEYGFSIFQGYKEQYFLKQHDDLKLIYGEASVGYMWNFDKDVFYKNLNITPIRSFHWFFNDDIASPFNQGMLHVIDIIILIAFLFTLILNKLDKPKSFLKLNLRFALMFIPAIILYSIFSYIAFVNYFSPS